MEVSTSMSEACILFFSLGYMGLYMKRVLKSCFLMTEFNSPCMVGGMLKSQGVTVSVTYVRIW